MRRALAVLSLFVLLAPVAAFGKVNDPYFPIQWGLSKIRATDAWSVSMGAGAVVAIVDTGVDGEHPDLKAQMMRGRDFADDDDDASDDNGHGTLIAGIVAATTFNGEGVASVAPRARILPVRVLGKDGAGTSSSVAEGIRWAVGRGADVINLSLAEEEGRSGPGIALPASLLRDPSVDAAIRDAANDGATVVIAAGNDPQGGTEETAYDATVPGVLVVGASTTLDRRAAYSNHGPGLDLIAPGGGTHSDPGSEGCTSRNSIVSAWWNPETKRSDYGGGCGTSMAVGFVSGVAAMLHATGMTNEAVVERILRTADDVGPAGIDEQTGHGRLNAARALGAVAKPPPNLTAEPGPERPKALAPGSGPKIANATTPRAAPAQGILPARPPVLAPSNDGEPQDRSAAVAVAAMLVCALGGAHLWRWSFGRRPD